MSREAQARESIRRLLRYALDGATCNDLEEVDNEEPPKAVEVIQELKARRADRLQHSKQGKLPSMVAEYLRVQVPLTADFECVCKICLSPDVSYGKRGSTDLYCRTCVCTAGKSDLRAMDYIDLKTNRVLHPVELEVATGLRCLPLAKSCPGCHHCQWERRF